MTLDPLVKQIGGAPAPRPTSSGGGVIPPRTTNAFASYMPAPEGVGEVLPAEETGVQKVQKTLGMKTKSAVGTVGDVLDVLRIGEFVSAGFFEEWKRAGESNRMGYLKSISKNIKQRKGYSDFTGSSGADLALAIFADPLTYTPASWIKAGAKAVGLAKGAKWVSHATDANTQLRKMKEMMGTGFIAKYRLRKYHPEELVNASRTMVNQIEGAAPRLGETVEKKLKEWVPDMQRRQDILTLAETVRTTTTEQASKIPFLISERKKLVGIAKRATNKQTLVQSRERIKAITGQIKGIRAEVESQIGTGKPYKILGGEQFNKTWNTYTKNEKEAFRFFRQLIANREQTLIRAELLTRSRSAGFLAKFGMNYVPHLLLTKEQTMRRLKTFLEAAKAGDAEVAARYPVEKLQQALKEIEEVEDLVGQAGRGVMYEWNRSPRASWWKRILKRKAAGTADEIAKQGRIDIETDLATIGGLATAQTLRLNASKNYIDGLVTYLEKQGILYDEKLASDPKKFFKTLTDQFGEKDGLKHWREGFKTVSGVKVLEGKIVPTAIADEVKETLTHISDPRQIEEFFKTWTKVQNFWKAYTLSIYPSYHSRNLISNLWNNSLAGMGKNPQDFQHYIASGKILASGFGKRQFGEGKVIRNWTEKQIYEMARDLRVIESGEMAGELGSAVGRYTDPWSWISPDPKKNLFVRKGFQFGRVVEDNARLGHFMWRLAKGDTPEAASRSVQKYLFDYKFGLTPFEKKFGRNFIMPFWAWTRFNLPLQLEMLATQPARFTGIRKVARAVENQWGGPDPSDVYMAEWLKNDSKVRMKYNEKTGDYEYFILDGWWPSADIRLAFSGKAFQDQLIGMISPLAKLFPELLTNYSLYQKGKISEFPGHVEKMFKTKGFGGVPVEARLAYLLKAFRPIGETDRTLQAIDRQGWETGVWRYMVGRTYPQNYERQKKWWTNYRKYQISEARRQKSIVQKRGELENVEALDRIIAETEAQLKEFD